MKNTAKKVFMFWVVAALAVIFILKSESASQGAIHSLKLCVYSVAPSLLPFMVLASYISLSGLLSDTGRIFEIFCRKFFRLPGESAGIIIMSFIGGFPVGAKMTASAVESGILSKNQGRRMMLFCVNAGPAFIVNIVGFSMLGSKKAGVLLLFSTILSSLLIGFASRFFDEKTDSHICRTVFVNKGGAVVKSVEQSVSAVISVCSWIVIFGAGRQIISDWVSSENLRQWTDMLCEVTNGCRTASQNFPLPVTAFVLGFSGFAVHAQILPFLDIIETDYKLFFASRALNGAIAAAIADILFRLFPCEIQVFASYSSVIPVSFSVSAYASAAAIFTAALIILDLAPAEKM